MPAQITIHEEGDILVITIRGPLMLRDLDELRARPLPSSTAPDRALVDLTAASVGLTYADMESVSRWEPVLTKIAILAPNAVAFGNARMFQSMNDGKRSIAVFSVRDDALRWLRQK